MTAVVLPFKAKKRNQEPDCLCRTDYRCYPHRIADAVQVLKQDLAATEGELMVSRARFAASVGAVLPMLEAIVNETLPDERTAQ